MNRSRSLSLGAKLNLGLLVFLILLAASASAILFYGFQRAQDDASARSEEALEEQGKVALQAFIGGIAAIGSLQLEAAAEAGTRATLYLDTQARSEDTAAVDAPTLMTSANGHHYDPTPGRITDLVVINRVVETAPEVRDDIDFSAPLDNVLPIVLQGFEGGVGGGDFDPTAILFISTNGVTRHYPATGIHAVLPADADFEDRLAAVGPVANPDRRTIWTAPAEDSTGEGQIMTASTPVYDGDTFRGSLEVHVSFARVVTQINGAKPTPRGFVFYVDSTGVLAHTDTFDLLSREAEANPQLAAVLASMRLGEPTFPLPVEKVELEGEEFLISYTASGGPGGSIAAAAPVSDITGQAALITAGIQEEGSRTLWFMLAALAVLFLAGLTGATYLNRRLLVAPLQHLAAATRNVAGGDLTANVDLRRNDELGELAADFNVMVEQLRESERVLEQRVEDRTHQLTTLLEVAKNVGSTLELQPLLQLILEQLKAVAPYDRSLIMVREGDELRGVAMRAEPGFEMEPSQLTLRTPIADGGVIWEMIERGEPAIIEDTHGDTPLADTWRRNNEHVLDSALRRVGSWMAVPMRLGDRTIGMLVTSKEERASFTRLHAELATAMGAHAALAIANAQLFEQAQRQARDMEALTRADAELFRSLSLDRVLEALVDVATEVLGVDKSVVILHEGDVDVVRAARNYDPANLIAFNQVLAGMPHVEPPPHAQTVEVIRDVAGAPDFIRAGLEAEGIVSAAIVPIRDSNRMLGTFGISFVDDHEFDESELSLYQALADRAAVAIQNAELYQRAQQVASLEERQRLARELHDSVSQALYGIALGTRTAMLRLGDDPHNAAEPIEYVASLAQAGLAEMRALIFELRPESLEQEGVVAAIEKQAASIAARYKLDVELDLGDEPVCGIEVKEALYRITQEALNNVVKHAQAERVEVRLRREAGDLALTIRDNGRGFDSTAAFPGHVGLRSMPERAQKLGGTLAIESAPSQGTKVIARLPVA